MSAIDVRLQQAEERLTVAHAQTGDREAFCRLVDLYDRRLYYFIRRIVGDADEAYDVLQAVWLQVHRSLGQLASPAAFRVWLYRIAHTKSVTELRRRSWQPVPVDRPEEETPVDTDDGSETFEKAELVHVALQDLSLDHRRVLTLRFLEDMSIEEIATVVECSSGTVRSRLHYAKRALRERIRELLDD
ncbi:ECF RNA polymerase sigma factor SigW [Maioricimonas rarisocia]|uniref:ECF RNA polymerase sigma factor SigW n=1 Tax=Maioricimonas rarisocia TaxID=2528026 RepID=A0A517ZEM8_9PLAN|nr:sigma-70 family RNA polymerase sigma factor [Maioricimonas rarisocia]QDU40921.1 ECF RNA polymerase sigma factor SigW [Maioricimonas rarisocia]